MSLIQEIGVKVSNDNLKKAEFIFWPKFDDRTEPDLVIIIGKYYLLFEAKYFSDFSIDQIKREIEGGLLESKNFGKDFYYIAITSDYYYMNEKFQDIIKLMGQEHFKWINWQTLCFIIENNIKGEEETDYYMAFDLFQLMLKKNLRSFQGFKNLNVSKPLSKIDNVFFDSTSTRYRGDFMGFIEVLKVFDKITKLGGHIFYNRTYFQNLNFQPNLKSHSKIFIGGIK